MLGMGFILAVLEGLGDGHIFKHLFIGIGLIQSLMKFLINFPKAKDSRLLHNLGLSIQWINILWKISHCLLLGRRLGKCQWIFLLLLWNNLAIAIAGWKCAQSIGLPYCRKGLGLRRWDGREAHLIRSYSLGQGLLQLGSNCEVSLYWSILWVWCLPEEINSGFGPVIILQLIGKGMVGLRSNIAPYGNILYTLHSLHFALLEPAA